MTNNPRPAWPSGVACIALTTLFLAGGCSRPVKVCPVLGTVLVNGKPVGGAYVVFHNASSSSAAPSPQATRTQDDGSFSIGVRGTGEYGITVFWPTVSIDQGEVIEGDDRFAGKYRNPERPVLNVTIEDGKNTISPIRLTLP